MAKAEVRLIWIQRLPVSILLSDHYIASSLSLGSFSWHQFPCHNKSYEKHFCRTWNPLPAHNRQWATVQLPRVLPVYRSIWYRAYHKLPTVSPVERICRKHGTNHQEYTTQGWWRWRGPIPWNTSYRTTPVDHQLKSPAELLNNRKFRTTLPTAQTALLAGIDRDQVNESLLEQQKQQAQYYNPSAGPPLPPLHDGQHIRLYDLCPKTWQLGTVQGQICAPRSYTVKSSTTRNVYRRTRSQLKRDTAFRDHVNTN